jgi:MFS family permease
MGTFQSRVLRTALVSCSPSSGSKRLLESPEVEIALPLKPALRHPALTLAVLAMAQFIIAVDYNIVYIALPSIGSALHFAPRQLQWVVSAYAITFGGLLLLGGRRSDLVGRRRSFIVALSLYGIGSLAGGIASQPALLIAARAVQGLGGALLFPTTLALVSAFYEEGLDRSGALAAVGAAGATGGASGALLGGLVTSAWGWSWTFFINVPIALAVATIAFARASGDDPASMGCHPQRSAPRIHRDSGGCLADKTQPSIIYTS